MTGTFLLLKPDVLQRNLIGKVLTRIESEGFVFHALRLVIASEDQVVEHYIEHAGREYFPKLVAQLAGMPVIAGVAVHRIAPERSVELLRALAGPYRDPLPGTIRGDFALNCMENSVHTADSPEAALREAAIWL